MARPVPAPTAAAPEPAGQRADGVAEGAAGGVAEEAEAWLARIRTALQPCADPARAAPMRAYMRQRFDFLGIATPQRRQAVAALGPCRLQAAALRALVEALWAQPQREFHYVAADLLIDHAARAWKASRRSGRQPAALTPADLPWLLGLAQCQAWWDTVDPLAGVVGDVLRTALHQAPPAARASVQAPMDQALQHPSLWVRRIALLHQLGWREDTDEARLFAYARTLAPETEFFIRKAIGWALRDHARYRPKDVAAFLAEQGERLSGLSRREAGKHLGTPLGQHPAAQPD